MVDTFFSAMRVSLCLKFALMFSMTGLVMRMFIMTAVTKDMKMTSFHQYHREATTI